ncbi:MAG TPA: Gfo/Idh/MocA family oxidoreductase [bacterium]|nr:Gfo/Idh/MocA family oxidoreductase [bacterium]
MYKSNTMLTRRQFLGRAAVTAAGGLFLPWMFPPMVRGQQRALNKITIGCIGVGRMGRGDLREILEFDDVQVVAVCDVDSWRLENAKQLVESHYGARRKSDIYRGCDAYNDYRDLLARPDIDAVQICTPDHWHALPAVEAARAGKDIFLQKPLTLTIPEGRKLSDTVRQYGRILQVGSQQRSDSRFRFAAELVRNGYIGDLHTVEVGFGKDPFTGPGAPEPVPAELNYEMWLGQAPYYPYIEKRVHPQRSYSRPGWLRTTDYCCGMITGWGSHHIDSAHWGMDTEYTGPVRIHGQAEFSESGVWDVHGAFRIEYIYTNGVTLICADNEKNRQGVLFKGTEGWVYVRRGYIDANPTSLLDTTLPPDAIHLYRSNDHKQNFLESIRSRRRPVAPVEIGHRSGSACVLGYIAMELGRELRWDPRAEQFVNDDQANRMVERPNRSPWHL